MSVTYGFYNSRNNDRLYDAVQMSSIFDGIIRDGVLQHVGQQLMVKESSGMTVTVGTGRAWFNHTWTYNDAILPLTLDEPEHVQNRIDAVVLEVDSRDNARKNSIKIVKGEPGTPAQNPVLIKSGGIWQYPLAYISVSRANESIHQGVIQNCVGTSQCPFVTAPLEKMNIDDLVAQWGAQWREFYNNQTADMTATNAKWKKQWETWFNSQTAEIKAAYLAWEAQWNVWYAKYTKDMTNTSTYWKDKWNAWFDEYTGKNEADMTQWKQQVKTDFSTWLAELHAALDGNIAAKLTNQVLQLQEGKSNRIYVTDREMIQKLIEHKTEDKDAYIVYVNGNRNIEGENYSFFTGLLNCKRYSGYDIVFTDGGTEFRALDESMRTLFKMPFFVILSVAKVGSSQKISVRPLSGKLEVVDDLSTDSPNKPISAAQGKWLNENKLTNKKRLLTVEEMNNANYPEPYVCSTDKGKEIGLPTAWAFLQYFRHENNDGYCTQIAFKLDGVIAGMEGQNHKSWTMKIRTSTGKGWQPWENVITSKEKWDRPVSDLNACIEDGVSYYFNTATANRPSAMTDGIVTMHAYNKDNYVINFGVQVAYSWWQHKIAMRSVKNGDITPWKEILTSDNDVFSVDGDGIHMKSWEKKVHSRHIEGAMTHGLDGALFLNYYNRKPVYFKASDGSDHTLQEVFQSASEGKTKVANTLTGMGTPTSTTATWDTIVNNLKQHKYKSGQVLDGYTVDILTPCILGKTQLNPKQLRSTMSAHYYDIRDNFLYLLKKSEDRGRYSVSRLNLISGVFEPTVNENALSSLGGYREILINQKFNDGLFVNDEKDYDNVSGQYIGAINKLDWNFNVIQRRTIIDIIGLDNFRNYNHGNFFVLKDKIYLLSWHKTNNTARVTILNSNDLTTLVFFKEIPFLNGYGVLTDLNASIASIPLYSVKHNLISWMAIGRNANSDCKLVVTDDLLNVRQQITLGNKNDSNVYYRAGMSDDCVFMRNGKVYSILTGQLLYNEWRLADKSIWNRNGVDVYEIAKCQDVAYYGFNKVYEGTGTMHQTMRVLSFVGDHIELWDDVYEIINYNSESYPNLYPLAFCGISSNGECLAFSQDSYYVLAFSKTRTRTQIVLK